MVTQVMWLFTTGLPLLPRMLWDLQFRKERVSLDDGTSLDVYTPLGDARQNQNTPVVVYVHGGAWGSGDSWNFSSVGASLSRRHANCTVLVLDYATTQYPSGTMIDQATSVAWALSYARARYRERRVVCIGHSSGAHVSSLALLGYHNAPGTDPDCLLADVFIAQAGVYDVGAHFLYESSRGVAHVSPMLPSCCHDGVPDPETMDLHSPLYHLQRMRSRGVRFGGDHGQATSGEYILEGSNAAQHLSPLLGNGTPIADIGRDQGDAEIEGFGGDAAVAYSRTFPQTFVQTAVADVVVPATGNLRYFAALRDRGVDAHLLLYEGEMSHGDFVFDWMASGLVERETKRTLFDWQAIDAASRRRLTTHLYGSQACSVDTHGLSVAGPSAHVRDIVRILEACRAGE
jgi:acetyl esterase/lipase